ncbi:hypothetical protein OIU78_022798 [Salix suchowensis]|nr:hypothetical protein OIU78_022798 [Salix suchowensis]
MSNTLKESFQVYKTYCESVAALVNMFFDLTRAARGLACQILKRASQQSQDLQNFFENCKRLIENKNLDYPVVQIITTDHIMALEQFSTYFGSSHSSSAPPILDRITNSTKLQTTMAGIEGDEKDAGNFSWSPTLFSCSLETKISKVWVVFED